MLGRMTLLVFILASAAFLSAITAMRIAIHGREVTNAESGGQECFRGEPDAAIARLVLRVADRIYSDQPINVVLRQTPTSGLLMKVSAAGARGAEPRAATIADSAARRQFPAGFTNRTSARGIAVGEVSAVTMPDQPWMPW